MTAAPPKESPRMNSAPNRPLSAADASELARAWVRAWNDHDLDAILSHYAEPLRFTSPLVVTRLGRADGTLRSKAELRAYFAQGLDAQRALRFELEAVLPGVDSLALCYRNHRGQSVVEVMRLNGDGLVDQVMVHYATPKDGTP